VSSANRESDLEATTPTVNGEAVNEAIREQ